jgi:folate-dependent phosphoribosylglycinamide formyltransferase PurN/NTP pyrophosphatase (non-canonical NTP hydrolase)
MKPSLLNQIIDIYGKNPRLAILMSGKGSNADVILSQAHRYSNLKFIAICSDNHKSNAYYLSQKYQLEYYANQASVTPFDRQAYFQELAAYLEKMEIDTLIYAGFMKISPTFFVKRFPGINVHPADLTLVGNDLKPKYLGMQAIANAVQHERYLASTAHIVDTEVDCGTPILVSKHLSLEGRLINNMSLLHEQMKISCEHLLFPRVLELLSKGLISADQVPYRWDELPASMRLNAGNYFSDKLLQAREIMTPLDLAYLSQYYSSEVGFDFTHIDQVMEKVIEEINELKQAYLNRKDNLNHFIDEIGDCFFSLVNLCRFINLHPEFVVSRNTIKYLTRCQRIESDLKHRQQDWSHLTPQDILPLWKKAKAYENNL